MMAEAEQPDLTALTVQLLSAYVSNNTVASGELAGLIESTRKALAADGKNEEPAEPVHVPAVTTRKSLASRDHIVSMIDGKPYKSLKRHLSTHGLSPAEYRARYKLADDYPMVAPGYSEERREIAKRLGLGRKKVEDNSAPTESAPAIAEIGSGVPRSKGHGKSKTGAATAAPSPNIDAPKIAPEQGSNDGKQKRGGSRAKAAKSSGDEAPKPRGRRTLKIATPRSKSEPQTSADGPAIGETAKS